MPKGYANGPADGPAKIFDKVNINYAGPQRASQPMGQEISSGFREDFSEDIDPDEVNFEDLLDDAFDFSREDKREILYTHGAYFMVGDPEGGLLHSSIDSPEKIAREALEEWMAQNMPETVADFSAAPDDPDTLAEIDRRVAGVVHKHKGDLMNYMCASTIPYDDMSFYGERSGLTARSDEIRAAVDAESALEIAASANIPIDLDDLQVMTSEDYSMSPKGLGRDDAASDRLIGMMNAIHIDAARKTMQRIEGEAEPGDTSASLMMEIFPECFDEAASRHLDALYGVQSLRTAVDLGVDMDDITVDGSPLSSYASSVAGEHYRSAARRYLSEASAHLASLK